MKIVKPTPPGRQRDMGEIFDGHVERWTVVGDESKAFRLTEVTFKAGARTKMHVHESEQILIVVSGLGALGDDRQDSDLEPGDVAYIVAGERHWHGARPGRDMTHWSLLGPGATQVV